MTKNNFIPLTNSEIDELSNFIFSIGPHGHRDWPNNQKLISRIIRSNEVELGLSLKCLELNLVITCLVIID